MKPGDTKNHDPDRMLCRMFKKALSHPPNPTRAETRASSRGKAAASEEARRTGDPLLCRMQRVIGTLSLRAMRSTRCIGPLHDEEQWAPRATGPRLEAFFNILLGVMTLGSYQAIAHALVWPD